jgi:hypothetical protein
MKHLPSVEALSDIDDARLLAELEICQMLEKLAQVRTLVDRADRLLSTVLACGEVVRPIDSGVVATPSGELVCEDDGPSSTPTSTGKS